MKPIFHPIKAIFPLKFLCLSIAYNFSFSRSPVIAPFVLALWRASRFLAYHSIQVIQSWRMLWVANVTRMADSSDRDVNLKPYCLLVPRLRISGATLLISLYVFMVRIRRNLPFLLCSDLPALHLKQNSYFYSFSLSIPVCYKILSSFTHFVLSYGEDLDEYYSLPRTTL
jgi:hypothetical protein